MPGSIPICAAPAGIFPRRRREHQIRIGIAVQPAVVLDFVFQLSGFQPA